MMPNTDTFTKHTHLNMYLTIAGIFVICYALIIGEHPFRINKAASALLGGALVWTILTIFGGDSHATIESFKEHSYDIANIVFFLLGAMVVVELMDAHDSFSLITGAIKTRSAVKLMIIIGLATFFLSATLDNLTTAIVMVAVLKRLIHNNKILLMKMAGIVIIAANAGGAWSPIGDVTTIMLWLGGQVTTKGVITELFIPSLVCLVVSVACMLPGVKGEQVESASISDGESHQTRLSLGEKLAVLCLGLLTLLGVPIFKDATHLPPYVGIFLGLGIMWVVTEVIHLRHPNYKEREHLVVSSVLRRIDVPSVLFFMGILSLVAGLQQGGHLGDMASFLSANLHGDFAINGVIGILSAVFDNVPLVAAVQAMYPLDVYPTDSTFWNALAYAAGTGGSNLIIGSAAGVAVMGILKIDFMWYLKRVSPASTIGYAAGLFVYYLMS